MPPTSPGMPPASGGRRGTSIPFPLQFGAQFKTWGSLSSNNGAEASDTAALPKHHDMPCYCRLVSIIMGAQDLNFSIPCIFMDAPAQGINPCFSKTAQSSAWFYKAVIKIILCPGTSFQKSRNAGSPHLRLRASAIIGNSGNLRDSC